MHRSMNVPTLSNLSGADELRGICSLPYAALRYAWQLLFSYLIPVMRSTRDWPKVVFVYLGIGKSAVVRLRNGEKVTVTRSNMRAFIIRMKYGDDTKSFSPAAAGRIKMPPYEQIDAAGKTVVDVGAYNGDSAMYFVKNRMAKRVIALEPVESLYRIALRNVSRMHLRGKIKLFNIALAGECNGNNAESFSLSLGANPRTVSLGNLIKRYKIRNAVLKIDCEGCEYGLIGGVDRNTAKSFDTVVVKYHRGYINIVRKLEQLGYTVRYTKPRFRFANAFRVFVAFGVVYATK